jgi:hypothetical protein
MIELVPRRLRSNGRNVRQAKKLDIDRYSVIDPRPQVGSCRRLSVVRQKSQHQFGSLGRKRGVRVVERALDRAATVRANLLVRFGVTWLGNGTDFVAVQPQQADDHVCEVC